MSFPNALYQWQAGERRLAAAPADRQIVYEAVIDRIVGELRRRLGGRFTSTELAELYDRGTAWCLEVAMAVAPEDPWAWDSAVVVDTAFLRYLRDAVDFAGGRLAPAS
jgi:hypothetical protein